MWAHIIIYTCLKLILINFHFFLMISITCIVALLIFTRYSIHYYYELKINFKALIVNLYLQQEKRDKLDSLYGLDLVGSWSSSI